MRAWENSRFGAVLSQSSLRIPGEANKDLPRLVFFQAGDKTLIFVYSLKRSCSSCCSWGLFSAALCKKIEAIPVACHTPSREAGQIQGLIRLLDVSPWLRWWGFSCFWMPVCIQRGRRVLDDAEDSHS